MAPRIAYALEDGTIIFALITLFGIRRPLSG